MECKSLPYLYKCMGPIIDYTLHFELLQFMFDRWTEKTITGAINSARKYKVNPYIALSNKAFSPSFWQWEHCCLIDAVHQFGLPSLFVRISPSEWSFTCPAWLHKIRCEGMHLPRDLACYQTLHYAHTLEQIVRGYLCGTNTSRWVRHIFNASDDDNNTSVVFYFYRSEFQHRGRVHLHLLVWLRNIESIQFRGIRADIPPADTVLGTLVCKFQTSDKASFSLPLQNDPTYIKTTGDTDILHLYHPEDALAANLRAYIASLLTTLNCSMDVQTTDGHGMILRYVASYVSKWKESFNRETMFSKNINASIAALKQL